MSEVRRSERGQVLAIVAMAMVAIVAMVGLVIDGGYAWSRQRDNQNGADAASKAGTVVIQHYLAGVDSPPPNDFDVACAVEAAATANGMSVESAEYVDFQGNSLLPNPVIVGRCTTDLGIGIPAEAQGVKARTSLTFETFLIKVLGPDTVTTEADAIAVVGQLTAIGGALPITFPEQGIICDNNAVPFSVRRDDGINPWEPYEIINESDANASNLAIVPLCDIGPLDQQIPGSVGWLDWGCVPHQNLRESIQSPCEISIPIPAWVHTQTGNPNCCEADINAYAGSQVGVPEPDDSVLAIPVHDFTCLPETPDLADSDPISACDSYPDWSGQGNSMDFHVPYWIGFKIDQAYVKGGDKECEQSPGQPVLDLQGAPGGGKVGCLKGWFVDRFDSPGPVQLGPIAPGSNVPMMVTLIN